MVIFVFGGFWFWLLIALESIYLISQIDDDDGGVSATLSFVVTLLLLNFLGDIPIIRWIWQNPGLLLGGLAGYLLLGVLWATAKWWFYVTNKLHEYKEKRASFLRENNLKGSEIPKELQDEWVYWLLNLANRYYRESDTLKQLRAKFLKENNLTGDSVPTELQDKWYEYLGVDRSLLTIVPQVADNKSRITTWMAYWPWSAFWTLLNDPIRRLFRRLYNNLREFYQKMSDKVFADVKNDFPGAGGGQ
jgi:hypothetical protein